ncbi:polysaccharide pyruvyl transferase family protein [Parapedobacter sp. DT-150]|uniref:polysaccharide pyruvyl transferase family protein n=1 Tax=Parapedobacter sp. DT-150 TaxID=3396162 RepID=UPI003F1B0CE7
MKIGIMTFWESKNNYGQILQLFAMQKILKKLGHDPFLIKYYRIPEKKKMPLIQKLRPGYVLRVIKYRLKQLVKQDQQLNFDDKREFDAFKRQFLVFGEQDYLSLLSLYNQPPVADAYIAGSDQVWNNSFSVPAEAFLLGFGGSHIRKIAYAASFGQPVLNEETAIIFRKYIHNFTAIGVREETGVDICRSLGTDRARWVVDPTLLFDKEDWAGLLHLGEETPKDTIFIYTLGNSEIKDKDKFIDYAKNLTGIGVVHASANNDPSGTYWPTIPQWVNNIRKAKLVITTSFHGMVFCLINNTNFIVLPNTGHAQGMNERIVSLLDLVGLKDHMMSYFSKQSFNTIMNKDISWGAVNDILAKKRGDSLAFLEKSLI